MVGLCLEQKGTKKWQVLVGSKEERNVAKDFGLVVVSCLGIYGRLGHRKRRYYSTMEVDNPPPSSSSSGEAKPDGEGSKNRFEVKRWNAVALWAWGK